MLTNNLAIKESTMSAALNVLNYSTSDALMERRRAPAEAPAAAAAPPMAEATVLLLGEDAASLDMLRGFLADSGYAKLVLSHDPRRLPQVMEQSPPDVILMDLNRAEVYDLEPLAMIRAREDMQHTPVIVMSGSVGEETRMRAIDLGADIHIFKPVNPRELLLRLRNALSLRSFQDRLANYDPLTGLPNRAMFLQQLESTLNKRNAQSSQTALLHLDLDRFKQVNEGLGHKMGDALLRAVAERLEGIMRDGDTVARNDAQEHTLSHLGGDEFSILNLRLRQPDDAGLIARRILTAMAVPFKIAGRELYVTPSIGIAIFPEDGEDAASLLKHADIAMDQAKKNGGNRFEFFSNKINQRSLERLSLENALRNAIEREELLLYYQPKVDTANGRLVGTEALMRWNHPSLGLVGPHRFIPVAEESGLILELGRWALHTACRQAKAWADQGLAGLHMAVNVSPVQFRQGRLDETVRDALRESGLDPAALTVELTESSLMSNVENTLLTLRALNDLGVDLSIDDFGTGFSSLSYLQQFPLDELKIDRSFIMELTVSDKSAALVSGILTMARGLDLRVVAEGVETEEQRERLRQLGCDLCQGYLFSKPVPAEKIPPLAGVGQER
jgi:diguanylate cyclase (GGDEF)-like protein